MNNRPTVKSSSAASAAEKRIAEQREQLRRDVAQARKQCAINLLSTARGDERRVLDALAMRYDKELGDRT